MISYDEENVIDGLNDTSKDFPKDKTIIQLFEDQAVLFPDKNAIIFKDKSLTYSQLNEKANQLAWHLADFHLTTDDIVGICVERSIEMLISVLGALKAGCCYLPLDPSFPDDRINYMFEDSGAKVLITQSFLKGKFHQFFEIPVVSVDFDSAKISQCITENPNKSTDSQSLAYIIYTSGSTGKPKGVKVHHEAVVNLLFSMYLKPGFSTGDRLLGVTTISFDISVLELFLPLLCGATLVLAAREDVFDGQKLSESLEVNEITVMQATPATWNILIQSGWKGKNNLRVLCGGEAMRPELIRNLLPKVESLWNMYGPTETTVWSTCIQITDLNAPIFVGKPINNTTIQILDDENNLLPVGDAGEVAIGGTGVTKGYHNRPDLNAAKFIKLKDGMVFYKTGDLGMRLYDGNIRLLGRLDNQIKIRGFRVEPGEIEFLLAGIPFIKDAVVIAQQFEDSDERLVAFLSVDPEFGLTNEEINKFLAHKLPTYMIPSFYTKTDAFPRLPNGKIDRKALHFETHLSENSIGTGREFVAGNGKELFNAIDDVVNNNSPVSGVCNSNRSEKRICRIWERILKRDIVDLNSNFFEIGGNSMLLAQMAILLKKEFGKDINALTIMQNPTINMLAKFLSD